MFSKFLRLLSCSQFILALLAVLPANVTAQVAIPEIDQELHLTDFEQMQPSPELAGKLALIENFVQSSPSDGSPPSQKTVVYLAYNKTNIYIIFVCFDNDPSKISASKSRREGFSNSEDWVEVYLDTFNDKLRAYCFSTNAFGVQWDSRYSEANGYSDYAGHQPSFDALWYSQGKITDRGYLVLMSIPFKSMRFPSGSSQEWRIIAGRSIPRNNEYVAWPHISQEIQGKLSQSSPMSGLQEISPGKNIQLIPYTSYRAFRLLDDTVFPPEFVSEKGDATAGLGAKMVVKDSSVVDVAINPDFSQVESDNPQVTVNQRFEVFFPEKRPFFLENAQNFQTPLNLVFTRRIGDPQFGGRLTGNYGPYSVGVLFANDNASGQLEPEDSPLFDKPAYFGIARLSRDILSQSNVGVLFTNQTFGDTHNTVAGGDFTLRLNNHWQASGQAVESWTRNLENESSTGQAYFGRVTRSGRKFNYEFLYNDFSPQFETVSGFIPRTDYRSVENLAKYYFRPEGDVLVAYGPELGTLHSWDYTGLRLDAGVSPAFYVELQRSTYIRTEYAYARQRIRPADFSGLEENIDFLTPTWNFNFSSAFFPKATLQLDYTVGKDVNFVPPVGSDPFLANLNAIEASMILLPIQRLQVRASYFFTELRDLKGPIIFDDQIISVRGNYQFTNEFSLRVIVQYESTIVNPSYTSLENLRNLNADILLTYLVNPWTALYVGYNGNRQNLDLIPSQDGNQLVRTTGSWLNDANQFFVKFSYLFRF